MRKYFRKTANNKQTYLFSDSKPNRWQATKLNKNI